MKNRPSVLLLMEILASVFASPKVKTRIAQACNINQSRIDGYLEALVAKGLISVEATEGKELYKITDDGYKVYKDWLELWRRLPLT